MWRSTWRLPPGGRDRPVSRKRGDDCGGILSHQQARPSFPMSVAGCSCASTCGMSGTEHETAAMPPRSCIRALPRSGSAATGTPDAALADHPVKRRLSTRRAAMALLALVGAALPRVPSDAPSGHCLAAWKRQPRACMTRSMAPPPLRWWSKKRLPEMLRTEPGSFRRAGLRGRGGSRAGGRAVRGRRARTSVSAGCPGGSALQFRAGLLEMLAGDGAGLGEGVGSVGEMG